MKHLVIILAAAMMVSAGKGVKPPVQTESHKVQVVETKAEIKEPKEFLNL